MDTLFQQTPIIQSLMRIANAAVLKELRKASVEWDSYCLKRFEEKAIQGQLKSIEIGNQESFDEAKKEFDQFLEDTKEIPKLFRGFKFRIPGSLKFLNLDFFSIYSLNFVELRISTNFGSGIAESLLKKFFSMISTSICELVISDISWSYSYSGHPLGVLSTLPNIPRDVQLIFPHLRKFIWKIMPSNDNETAASFSNVFFRGGKVAMPSLTILEFTSIPGNDLSNFLGLEHIQNRQMNLELLTSKTRWNNLSNMKINNPKYDDFSIWQMTSGLRILGGRHLALKHLELIFTLSEEVDSPNFPEICRNLDYFISTQGESLQVLKLGIDFKCRVFIPDAAVDEEEWVDRSCKIRLPVFQNLHSLDFNVISNVYLNGGLDKHQVFEFDSLLINFPRVTNLSIPYCTQFIPLLFPETNIRGDERISLHRLSLGFFYNNVEKFDQIKDRLNTNIQEVGILDCPSAFLAGKEIPWKDSIREVHIHHVRSQVKLSQIKNLTRIFIYEWFEDFGENREKYLEFFPDINHCGNLIVIKIYAPILPMEGIVEELYMERYYDEIDYFTKIFN